MARSMLGQFLARTILATRRLSRLTRMANKNASVSEKTFKSWDFSKDFCYDVDDGGLVTNLKCLLCSKHWDEINRWAKSSGAVKGPALNNLKSYIDGIDRAHKGHLKRHCDSAMHVYAKGLSAPTVSVELASSDPPGAVKRPFNQPTVANMMQSNSVDTYKKLLRSVLHIVRTNGSLRGLRDLVNLQRSNGVKMMFEKDSTSACKAYIKILSKCVSSDVKSILEKVDFVSVLSDGSEARKTKEEE